MRSVSPARMLMLRTDISAEGLGLREVDASWKSGCRAGLCHVQEVAVPVPVARNQFIADLFR